MMCDSIVTTDTWEFFGAVNFEGDTLHRYEGSMPTNSPTMRSKQSSVM